MYPRKTNARRGYRERELERKKSREQVASEWQHEFFPPKEENKVKTIWKVVIAIGTLVLIGLCLWGTVFVYRQVRSDFAPVAPVPTAEAPVATEAPAAPTEPPAATEAPTAAPTEPPVATEAPLVEEPVIATTEAPAPVAPVSCNTPSIKAGLNAADIEFGEYLDTNLGKRITFTSRKVVVPAKAWNDPLTSTELKSVETTWQSVQVCIPSEMVGRVFASGFEQGAQRYENGVIMTLEPGRYNFKLRNGEVVIWYPEQGMFVKADLERIIAQIKVGNFDIKAPLAFFGVTPDILPNIPADLVKERNVQLIQFPEPNVK